MKDDNFTNQASIFVSSGDCHDFEKKLKELESECEHLRKENADLKRQLASKNIQARKRSKNTSNSEIERRVKLFASLFKGRTDAFPKRWESRNGKSGYSPSCDNEWIKPLCEKPRIKCGDCKNRALTPLSNEVLYDHLSGKQTIGVYPLLQDDSCRFLAVDFDKANWQDDVSVFIETCDELGVPASLERSRSGNGGHIWIFFSEFIPAILARQMGNVILGKTMDKRIEVGLDSYDRFFPNQDTMPSGGFGNLIALPLQKQSRKYGNSVFIDRDMEAYSDQWQYLSAIQRMSKREVEDIVAQQGEETSLALDDGSVESNNIPWKSTQTKSEIPQELFPKNLQITLANGLYIEKEILPSLLVNRIIHLAVFRNPEFYKAQAMRMPVYNKPRMIACYDDLSKYIVLPRGCLDDVIQLLDSYKINVEVIDECANGKPLQVSFVGKLRIKQRGAIKELRKYDFGVLSATTAFGKTVVAAKMLAVRKRNTLILVHRKQLLEQWRERLATFLSISVDDIGQIGGGKKAPNGKLDIALLQSLYRNGEVYKEISEYGHIVVDECHHLSAFSFEQILKQVKAKYVLGLTATPIRKDGHHPIIFMQCGAIRYEVDSKNASLDRPFEHVMIPRNTNFSLAENNSKPTINQIYQNLTEDDDRNEMIISDVISCVKKGRSPLVLTERVSHLGHLVDQLTDKVENIIVLHGGMSKKQLDKTKEQLNTINDNDERVVIATGKYIGEGFDDPRLDTLFLAMPISWKGTLQQYAGRLHRLYDSKKEVRIYDYVDDQVQVLQRMYVKRKSGYRAMGYSTRDFNNS